MSCSADEVVEAGHHPVARPTFLEGVVHRGVEPAAIEELLAAGAHALASERLAVLLGDLARRVVQVTSAVGPQHVVQHEHWERCAVAVGAVREQLELVVDGVPVVVTVDERGVHRWKRGEHIEAERLVEVVAAGKLALVLARIEVGHGIDDVELGVRPEVLDHLDGGLASQRADLHDLSGLGGTEHPCDGNVPQREHLLTAPLSDRRKGEPSSGTRALVQSARRAGERRLGSGQGWSTPALATCTCSSSTSAGRDL